VGYLVGDNTNERQRGQARPYLDSDLSFQAILPLVINVPE